MTYNEHTGENIVYKAHISWWNFTGPVILFILAISANNGLGRILAVIAFFWFILKLIQHLTTELYIGEKFIVAKYGLIRRETIELLNSKVETIKVNQGVIGRILGYGDITIIGGGGTHNPIKFISKPVEFRNAWMNSQA